MSDANFHVYTGGKQNALPDFVPDTKLNDPALYQPSDALKNAVNVAISLGRPLLLTGEPGSGKTQLAHNIAYSFGLDQPLIFNTRTTSKATDLFYHYDALGHLQHIQTKGKVLSNEEVETQFIRYRALGLAIQSSTRQVVLIDEVDKAPRDFPNDLLNILEDLRFEVPEVQKTYETVQAARPILVLTSNSEKNMPDAFLRRCIYFHLPFPAPEELLAIISGKMTSTFYSSEEIKNELLPFFMQIREIVRRKKPGTAELLNWITVMEKLEFPAAQLKDFSYLDMRGKKALLMSSNVLVKTEEDLNTVRSLIKL